MNDLNHLVVTSCKRLDTLLPSLYYFQTSLSVGVFHISRTVHLISFSCELLKVLLSVVSNLEQFHTFNNNVTLTKQATSACVEAASETHQQKWCGRSWQQQVQGNEHWFCSSGSAHGVELLWTLNQQVNGSLSSSSRSLLQLLWTESCSSSLFPVAQLLQVIFTVWEKS